MAKNLEAIRAIVRQFLNDELVSGQKFTWENDELDLHIGECLAEISEYSPYEVKETLTTTAGSKELDISSIEDFLGLEGEHEIEYPTDSDPPNYHNASIFGNTLRMIVDRVPSADEDVYLYCHKLHQLTKSSSTLKPQEERVLIKGTVAYAALSWTNQVRVQVKEAVTLISSIHTAIGNMSARLTQAADELISGRDLIEKSTALADAAIKDVNAMVIAAIGDLTIGQALINQLNQAGVPQTDLAHSAAGRLSVAQVLLNQARGYLSVDSPSREHGNYAARELSTATGYLNQGGGYTRELTARLSIANLINSYQVWANNKLALYQRELRRLIKPRTYQEYPKS